LASPAAWLKTAAHQLKVLLEMMKCLQFTMSLSSS
jgi:hypothetical protein